MVCSWLLTHFAAINHKTLLDTFSQSIFLSTPPLYSQLNTQNIYRLTHKHLKMLAPNTSSHSNANRSEMSSCNTTLCAHISNMRLHQYSTVCIHLQHEITRTPQQQWLHKQALECASKLTQRIFVKATHSKNRVSTIRLKLKKQQLICDLQDCILENIRKDFCS